jgi:hypothetical protein
MAAAAMQAWNDLGGEGGRRTVNIRHSHGWTHYLRGLVKAAIGIDPGPDIHPNEDRPHE